MSEQHGSPLRGRAVPTPSEVEPDDDDLDDADDTRVPRSRPAGADCGRRRALPLVGRPRAPRSRRRRCRPSRTPPPRALAAASPRRTADDEDRPLPRRSALSPGRAPARRAPSGAARPSALRGPGRTAHAVPEERGAAPADDTVLGRRGCPVLPARVWRSWPSSVASSQAPSCCVPAAQRPPRARPRRYRRRDLSGAADRPQSTARRPVGARCPPPRPWTTRRRKPCLLPTRETEPRPADTLVHLRSSRHPPCCTRSTGSPTRSPPRRPTMRGSSNSATRERNTAQVQVARP